MGRKPSASALDVTNFVCGMGPSAASTNNTTPSTMLKMRSTSPPKSAWPGVSTILMRAPFHSTLVAFARIVIPRSRSRSLLSIARSATAWFSRKAPDCLSSSSTRVVLPWSTWAIIAILRSSIGIPYPQRGRVSQAHNGKARQKPDANARGRDWVCRDVAERQGFEPWVESPPQRFSRPPRSTTPAPLRALGQGGGGIAAGGRARKGVWAAACKIFCGLECIALFAMICL